MGGRINTIMQVCFFALSGVLPREEAIEAIKDSIKKTYGKKGEEIVAMNLRAVDNTLEHLHEVQLPEQNEWHRTVPSAYFAQRASLCAGCPRASYHRQRRRPAR